MYRKLCAPSGLTSVSGYKLLKRRLVNYQIIHSVKCVLNKVFFTLKSIDKRIKPSRMLVSRVRTVVENSRNGKIVPKSLDKRSPAGNVIETDIENSNSKYP